MASGRITGAEKANYDLEACVMNTPKVHMAHLWTQMDTAVTATAFDVQHLSEAPSLTPVYAALLTQYGINRSLRELDRKAMMRSTSKCASCTNSRL